MDAPRDAAAAGSAKRRRIVPHPIAGASITDLTDDTLCDVASYLPKTSQALLAVALAAPASSWRATDWRGRPNSASRAVISSAATYPPRYDVEVVIEERCREYEAEVAARGRRRLQQCWDRVRYEPRTLEERHFELFREGISRQVRQYYEGQRWEVLDFADVDMALASRLTDEDVGAILALVDAENTVRRLKLTHCTGVVGYGLAPLRSSAVLERLDAGYVRQFEDSSNFEHSPVPYPATGALAVGPLCRVLDVVLRGEGSRFRGLHFPYEWCQIGSGATCQMRGLLKDHFCLMNSLSGHAYFSFPSGGPSSASCEWETRTRRTTDDCSCRSRPFGHGLCAGCNRLLWSILH